ncbi:Kinesin-like protein KIF28P, partial [Fragariocoptes setiger]
MDSSNNQEQSNNADNIRVAVRVRPFTTRERQRQAKRIIDIEQNTVNLIHPKASNTSKQFTFDYSYWSHDGFKTNEDGVNVPDSNHPNAAKYADQERVFQDLGRFLLNNAIEGYNSALLAYGQTGSGKSYTISGYGHNEGILPRFARALFEELDAVSAATNNNNNNNNSNNNSNSTKLSSTRDDVNNNNSCYRYEIHFSMLEIYNEVVRDLLAKADANQHGTSNSHGTNQQHRSSHIQGLKVREHPRLGFFAEGLTSVRCYNRGDIEARIDEGQLNKSIAATNMNETSSRGHTIYKFTIRQVRRNDDRRDTVTCSTVQLVDLAGSERTAIDAPAAVAYASRQHHQQQQQQLHPIQSSSSNSTSAASAQSSRNHHKSQRFKESVSINQSLSALGNCIHLLSQQSSQAQSSQQQSTGGNISAMYGRSPRASFRDSVLTKLLERCCLGGNSKTVIIATVSPADVHYDDTLSTLRFADRAKQIKQHAVVNKSDPMHATVHELRQENERLKEMVDRRSHRSDDSSQTSNFDDTESVMENFMGPASGDADVASLSSGNTHAGQRARTVLRSPVPSRHERPLAASSARQQTGHRGRASNVNKQQISSNHNKSSSTLQPTPGQRNTRDSSRNNKDRQKQQQQQQRLSHLVSPASDKMPNNHDDDRATSNPFDDITTTLNDDATSTANDADAIADLNEFDKIELVNRSGSVEYSNNNNQDKAGHKIQRSMRRVALVANELKRRHPYLSNLNSDEQLSAKIAYIIREGDMWIGKNEQTCDIVLHGPNVRAEHAKLHRDPTRTNRVFLESVDDALTRINGVAVSAADRVQLKHCDRLVFGTNAYFVYVDPLTSNVTPQMIESKISEQAGDNDLTALAGSPTSASGNMMLSVSRPEQVTYELARMELLAKSETTRQSSAQLIRSGSAAAARRSANLNTYRQRSKAALKRTATTTTAPSGASPAGLDGGIRAGAAADGDISEQDETMLKQQVRGADGVTSAEMNEFKDELLDLTLPLQEANVIAKELNVPVSYEFEVLTGEEQLISFPSAQLLSLQLGNMSSDNMWSVSSADDSSGSLPGTPTATPNMTSSVFAASQGNYNNTPPPAVFIRAAKQLLNNDNNKSATDNNNNDNSQNIDDTNVEQQNPIDTIFFYWSKANFLERYDRMKELYGIYEHGQERAVHEHLRLEYKRRFLHASETGASSVTSASTTGGGSAKYSAPPNSPVPAPALSAAMRGRALVLDPFFDAPHMTDVLIGHAQLYLKSLAHMVDINEQLTILDTQNEPVGMLSVVVVPCHDETGQRPYSEQDLVECVCDDPRQLLDKTLYFMLTVVRCTRLPTHRYTNIYCQYRLHSTSPIIRTRVATPFNNQNNDDSNNNNNIINNNSNNQNNDDEADTMREQTIELVFDHVHVIAFDPLNEDILELLLTGALNIQIVGQYKLDETQLSTLTPLSPMLFDIEREFADAHHKDDDYDLTSNASATRYKPLEGRAGSGQDKVDQIDVILTRRKLMRAEYQLQCLKKTVNEAEFSNRKNLVKKVLSYQTEDFDNNGLLDQSPIEHQLFVPYRNVLEPIQTPHTKFLGTAISIILGFGKLSFVIMSANSSRLFVRRGLKRRSSPTDEQVRPL